MARRQGHMLDFRGIPSADDHTAGIGMVADQIKHIGNLVDGAVGVLGRRRRPATPLCAVHRAQIAVLVGPLIPDMHVILLKPTHVGGTLQEPKQFVSDAAEEHGLGGEQREIFAQIEAHLLTEQRNRTGTSAV